MKLYPILFILVCYIIPGGCISANNDTEVCNDSYSRAEKFIVQYAEKSEITYLHSALASLDTALKCNNTRLKSINLAISIYFLSKEYDKGKRFIDSLQMQDFTLPYKKNMYSGLFQAAMLEQMNDSTGSKSVYKKLAGDIAKSLTNQTDANSVRETLNNLVYIRSKIMGRTETEIYLDSIKLVLPNHTEYLDSLLTLYYN